jgi:predicted metal-binding membrane protein
MRPARLARSAGVPSWTESGSPRRLPRELTVVAALLAPSLVAWAITYRRMRGMDMGPGTELGGLAWFVGVWVVMMAAMMLPSLAPAAVAYSSLAERRAPVGRQPVPTLVFVGGYLVAWTLYGLIAYAVYGLAADAAPGLLAWNRGGRYVAAGALVCAGIYELTPLKQACLRRCRGPIAVLGRWRDDPAGALEMGLRHGRDCIGCCLGLMLTLFALGVMSLAWMAIVGAAIAAEKLLPRGGRVALGVGAAVIVAGVWVAASPSSFPGLTIPG